MFGAVDRMLQKWYSIELNNELWLNDFPHHWMRCALSEKDKDKYYSESYKNSVLAFRQETGLNLSPDCKYICEDGNSNDALRTSSILSGIKEPKCTEVLTGHQLRQKVLNEAVSALQKENGIASGIPFNFERDFKWVKSTPEEIKYFHLTDQDMVSLYKKDSKFYSYFTAPCSEVQLLRCKEDWSHLFEIKQPKNEICAALLKEMTGEKNRIFYGFEFDHVRKFIESVEPLYSERNYSDVRAKIFEEYVGIEDFGRAYHDVCLQEGLKNAFYKLKTDTMLPIDLNQKIFESPLFSRYRESIREGLESKYPPLFKSEHELRKAAVSLVGEMKEKNFIKNLSQTLGKAGKSLDKINEVFLDALRRGKDVTLPDGTSICSKKTVSGSSIFEVTTPKKMSGLYRDDMEL